MPNDDTLFVSIDIVVFSFRVANLIMCKPADSTFKCMAIQAVRAARNCAQPMAAVRRFLSPVVYGFTL